MANCLLFLIFFSVSIKDGWAQVFEPPSAEILMIVNADIMKEAERILQQSKSAKDCPEQKIDYSLLQSSNTLLGDSIPTIDRDQEVYCLCEVDKKNEGIVARFFGENRRHELSAINGNDNFMHGAFQLNESTRGLDGDDRGRTFNMGSAYSLIGDKGEFKLKLDSTGFGKFNPQNGFRKDPDGKYFLNFHELNTLSIELNKIKGSKENKWLLLSEFSFENETDQGNLSRAFQEEWHKKLKINGHKAIQYHYLSEKPDQNTVKFLFGLGKEFSKDFGNLNCQVRIEAKTGLSVNNKTDPLFLSRSNLKLSHRAIPYLVFQAWASYGEDFRGSSKSGGVEVSFPMKIKGMEIKPFIGVEKHYTPLDSEYGKVSGNAHENYHVFGFKISY